MKLFFQAEAVISESEADRNPVLDAALAFFENQKPRANF